MARTGILEPERRVDSFPHQLSGGQRQRAMIAMALACKPKLLIADEPTTALDWTIRARIIQLLLDLQAEEVAKGQGLAILLITHDLNLVRRFAQRVAVMEEGKLVETASTEEIFSAPKHPYTIKLINSLPVRTIKAVPDDAQIVLETRNLRVEYQKKQPGWRGWFSHGRFVALADTTLQLKAGETVGVVGESGSGKSTLAQAILNLIPVESGSVLFENRNFVSLSTKEKRALRARLQVVFQDPFGSLSPRRNVEQIVSEGLSLHYPDWDATRRLDKVIAVPGEVGLSRKRPATAIHMNSRVGNASALRLRAHWFSNPRC